MAVSASNSSQLLQSLTFSNSNSISFGLSNGVITASILTNAGGVVLSAGTQSAVSGNVIFSNSNGVTFGMNNSIVTASVGPSAVGSISAGTTSVSLGQVVFSNSNNVSFGLAASIVTATASFSQSIQTQSNIQGISAGTQIAHTGNIVFSNSNGITFGMSGSSRITASYTVPIQTQYVFSNSNNVSFGTIGSTVTASVNAPSVVQNVLIVQKNPGPGEFLTIEAAIATISGSSPTNLFVIKVGPGIYDENELFVPAYVSIIGSSIQPTIIRPIGNHHLFNLQNVPVELSFFGIYNVPSNFAGIYVNDAGDFTQVHKITFVDCDINIWIKSITQDTVFYGEYIDFNGTYSIGTKIEATNGFRCFANLENYYNLPGPGVTCIGTYVTGVGSELDILASGNIAVGGLGTGIYVEDGADVDITSTSFKRWDIGIRVGNVGATPTIDVVGSTCEDSSTLDLLIEHVTTTGTINGTFTMAKTSISSSDVSLLASDPTDGITFTGDINLGTDFNSRTDVTDLILSGPAMGLYDGGELSDGGGFDVDYTAGFGYTSSGLNDERQEWSAGTITLSANVTKYIFVDNTGTIVADDNFPDTISNILLGRVNTNDTGIQFIDDSAMDADHIGNRNDNMIRGGIGAIFNSGCVVSENITPFHLDSSSGVYYFGSDKFAPSSGTNITFTSFYQDGLGGWNRSSTNVVDTANYDDGSGTLQTVIAGQFVRHSLYLVGDTTFQKYLLVYGQSTYASLALAENGNIPVPPSYFVDGVVLIASIIVQSGSSDIMTTGNILNDVKPRIGFAAPSAAAALIHNNLLGRTASGAHPAVAIDFTPAGGITATNIQAAIQELNSSLTNYQTTGAYLTTQSAQAFSAQGGSSNFQTLIFTNSNGFSFSNTGGSIWGSYTVPTITHSSWTVSDAATSGTVGRLAFTNLNGVTLSLSTGANGSHTIVGSHNAITSQTNQNISLFALGNTTQNSSTILNANNLSFNGLGIITAGFSNGSIQLSASQSTVAQNISLFGLNQTTQNSSTVLSANALSFAGRGLITVGYSNGSIQLSATQTVDTAKAGTGFTSAGNNIGLSGTLNTNGLSLSATVAAQSNQNISLFAIGNTTQNSSTLLNAGNLSFNGLGIITAGFSNGSIQFSASQSTVAQNISLFGLGNTTQNSSTALSANALSFNAIGSLTIGYSNGSVQLSAPNALTSQTNQTIGLYALGNTTQNSSTILDARTLSFNGLGIITAGYSNGSIQLSATQSVQSIGAYAVSNTTQNTSGTIDARSLSFQGAGIASVGVSNGSIVVSVPSGGGGITNINLSAGTTSNNLSAFVLSNSNNVSFGLSGSTITASASFTAQSNQTIGLYALGNTTQNSSTTLDARTLSFNGLGIITAGYSNGSIQLSATQSNQAASASNGSFAFQTLNFSNANNVTFGTSAGSIITASVAAPGAAAENNNINLLGANTAGNTTASGSTIGWSGGNNITLSGTNGSQIVISAANQTNQSLGLYALGNTTQNSSTTLDARTLSYNALGAMTMGYSNGSIQVSAPATSSLSATGNVSISVNGSTISIGAPLDATLSRFDYPGDAIMPISTIGTGSLSFNRFYNAFNVTANSAMIVGSISASAAASTGTQNISLWMGIYTLNGSNLSLASSGSQSHSFQVSSNTAVSSNYIGLRQLTVPMTINMTPGVYWMAAVMSTGTVGTACNLVFSIYGNSIMGASVAPVAIGVNTTAGRGAFQMQGLFTANTSAGPTSIGTNAINMTSANNLQRANFYFQVANATY